MSRGVPEKLLPTVVPLTRGSPCSLFCMACTLVPDAQPQLPGLHDCKLCLQHGANAEPLLPVLHGLHTCTQSLTPNAGSAWPAQPCQVLSPCSLFCMACTLAPSRHQVGPSAQNLLSALHGPHTCLQCSGPAHTARVLWSAWPAHSCHKLRAGSLFCMAWTLQLLEVARLTKAAALLSSWLARPRLKLTAP